MKILVLGANGFIGRNIVEHFTRLGNEVIAHSRSRWGGDLRSPSVVRNLVRDVDIVIQCAATTSGSKDITTRPEIHVTDNAIMNALIFRAAHDAGVKHVIFFSCTTMFRDGVITEESEIDVHPKYFGVAHTKLYNEKMAEFYAGLGRTKFTVIRHSNCYGQHDKFDLSRSHVFGATVTKVMQATDTVKVWGTGEEARDLLYVSDLVDFVVAAIEKQPGQFGLYNAGSGYAVKIKDLVQKVIDASGKKLQIEYDVTAPSIPTSLWLDCTKAANELGWEPKVSLEDGIVRTLNWWRANV